MENIILATEYKTQMQEVLNCSSLSKNYEVVSELGSGSFGSVYLVEDQKGKKFALKKVPVDPFNIQQSFMQIEVMKKLYHHNLIKIYDYSFENDKQYIEIVMEYCQEGDLLHYFKKKNKTLSVRDILKIFKQIVEAFIAMNVKGVFHRDLKPENILLAKGLVVKIADFGCARSVNTNQMSKLQNFSLDKGTPIYASPEQLMNQKYSSKCDIWSSGVLLFLIYFGFHPFMGPKIHNTLSKIKQLTQNKNIQIPANSDLTIAKLIKLTLVFEDKQRASWRELWLSRLFADKIQNIKAYVKYVHQLSKISNAMTKLLWIARKLFQLKQKQDQAFIYFFIKFQYTTMIQASSISQKSQQYQYLFQAGSWKAYTCTQDLKSQIKLSYQNRHKFFIQIKKKLQSKDIFKQIEQKDTKRTSSFCDLDHTLKYGYKILQQVSQQFQAKRNNKEQIDYKVWTFLAKWINFQKWFGFEKEPRLEKIIAENINDPQKFIKDQLQRYQSGDVV